MEIRKSLDSDDFIEVETPMLTKSTPEGARDYVVPSRVHPGRFYALPQSPQLFKQLLMVSGFERYFQIVKCFRDEDLRADRQPEFTQVDLEMSFVNESDIQAVTNNMLKKAFETAGLDFPDTVPEMTYETAMETYGSDRPDLRYDLPLCSVTDICKSVEFKVFNSAANNGGAVKTIRVPKGTDHLSRKIIDELAESAKPFGCKGLAWIHIKEEGPQGPIAKFFSDAQIKDIIAAANGEMGDTLLFVADAKKRIVNESLGHIRSELAKRLNLIKPGFVPVWITEFPLVEVDEETGHWTPLHHPFTSPNPEDMEHLESNPGQVRSRAYDIVINGMEIGGGSIRIHDSGVQERIFKLLNLSDEDIRQKFGFFVDALKYGTPPHGGIALGFDRLVMMLSGGTSLRDVIAFPKTSTATCPLTAAPSEIGTDQTKELGLTVPAHV